MKKRSRKKTTKVEPDSNQYLGQDRKFLGAGLGFLNTIFGIFAAILFAASGLLATYFPHKGTPSVLSFASGLLFLALLANLHWRNNRNLPLTGLTSMTLFISAMVILVVMPLSFFLQLRTTSLYGVSCRQALWTPGRPLYSPLMVEYSSKLGPTLSPVHLMVSVTITNLQATSSTITSFSADSSSSESGPWTSLTPVPTLWSHPYFAANLHSAAQIDMKTDALDQILDKRALNSHETVHGWTLWECPDPSGCTYSFLRFHLEDASGKEDSVICSVSRISALRDWTNLDYLNVHGPIDVSKDRVAFISRFER